MTRSSLYGLQRWKRRSQQQLRKEPLCRICRALGKVEPATVADHIVPHRGNPTLFWDGELQSLCKHCHDSLKAQQEYSGTFTATCRHGLSLDASSEWACRECLSPALKSPKRRFVIA